MRDREIVQRIKDSIDLASLVGQAVRLRKQGAAWVGLCPFHSEKSPSFQVLPDRGFYHCFGCGKHGDAFTWMQEREGMSFPEALEALSGMAGIELPKSRERSAAEMGLEEKLRACLDEGQAYYRACLQASVSAHEYLKGRGLNDAFILEAGFGYAPEGWENLVNHLRKAGFSPEIIEQSGLASRSERGKLFDFLRHRITIPIHDARGRLIAFGGRTLGDDKAKYMNTRETQLFNKSAVLFGFSRAKGGFRDGALVVEGYFDVLHLHQEGLNMAVAPMGTALTEQHLQMVSRFTKKLILCFDGDAAGMEAIKKALKLALPKGFDVRLLLLPQGEDPDTWCMKLGGEAFREVIRRAPDWTSFVMDQARMGRDMKKAADRMEIFKIFIAHFVFLPDTPEYWTLLQSIAHELEIPGHEINRALNAQKQKEKSESNPGQGESLPVAASRVEEELDELLRPLLVLCREPAIRALVAQVPPAWWEGLKGAPLLQCLLDAEGDESLIPEEVLAKIRYFEASWAPKDDAELHPDRALLKLEADFIQREILFLNAQLVDPSVAIDSVTCSQVESKVAGLLSRKTDVHKQLRSLRNVKVCGDGLRETGSPIY